LEHGCGARRKRGVQIRDYLAYNPDAASVKEKRRLNAKRQADYRERQRHPKRA
jgi:hypothetical protein